MGSRILDMLLVVVAVAVTGVSVYIGDEIKASTTAIMLLIFVEALEIKDALGVYDDKEELS